MSLITIAFALTMLAQAGGPDLERRLAAEDPSALGAAARAEGDPARGARLFHEARLNCVKCHAAEGQGNPLGPDLAAIGKDVSDAHLVESILNPSKVIKKGYETRTIETKDGRTISGLVAEDRPDVLIVRDAAQDGRLVAIDRKEIEAQKSQNVSLMPAGLAANLGSRQEFLDLVRYLGAIADGGPAALALQPDPATLAGPVLPAYERDVDHAGLIRDLGAKNFQSGEAIYARVCATCHGTKDAPGSMPTSPRFAGGTLRNGGDPYSIYRTLTHGFGQMPPQTWMVPRQKYDVIHYLREAFFRSDNPRYYTPIGRDYLATLPKGTTRGPAPSTFEPWSAMDYGPALLATLEVGDDDANYAYKGIAIRLDPGPGGVARGRRWVVYDHDTMRLAGAWHGEGFIDWHGINFDGRHEIHPRVMGTIDFASPNGPGWADPATGRFEDPRTPARDGRAYGPLPRDRLRFRGLYQHGERSILSYSIGATPVLEMPGLDAGAVTRTIELGPRQTPLTLQVARDRDPRVVGADGTVAPLSIAAKPAEESAFSFDGKTRVAIAKSDELDMAGVYYTIVARIRTRHGGTILSKTKPDSKWVPDGKALFVRGGRLVFDIGWVGAVTSKVRVDDDRWHDVAMTFSEQDGAVRLDIDGKPDAQGILKPRQNVDPAGHVVRIGFAATDFPEGQSYFKGEIAGVQIFRGALKPDELARIRRPMGRDRQPQAQWVFGPSIQGPIVRDATGHGYDGTIESGEAKPIGPLLVNLAPPVPGAEWRLDGRDLRLKLPAGPESLKFTIRLARGETLALAGPSAPIDLAAMTKGGPRRWDATIATKAQQGDDRGPFAVDRLTLPDANPWLCRIRPTGFDFDAGGRAAWVCTWDGDVWHVAGLDREDGRLTWRRVASGLFQPLGLKVVAGTVYVLGRDQIAVLRDENGDGEADFVECFNSDHQVTESFHEFAMDLQTDASGNFYYAKGARHGKSAVVPQHGTLLRVAADGGRTDILATGFRAPNGVCVNADGTFFLTDQEGFWMPKNRINWVRPGRFYGNLWGYTDVTDPSDAAMEPPVCWITNAVDRSPAEVVRVEGEGAAWRPLRGQLLNLSYGYGKIFVVPHEQVGDQIQGGVSALPIPRVGTGLIRGRFSPLDGQLYACGMFAWAGNQQQPGGFYRIRATGKTICAPIGLSAHRKGMAITFSAPLDPAAAADVAHYAVKTWALKRSANYGSEHIDEHPSPIKSASRDDDGRTVFLEIPGLAPTWCMEIRYAIKTAEGEPVVGSIDNTIHRLRD